MATDPARRVSDLLAASRTLLKSGRALQAESLKRINESHRLLEECAKIAEQSKELIADVESDPPA
jgi:hypothetical protein